MSDLTSGNIQFVPGGAVQGGCPTCDPHCPTCGKSLRQGQYPIYPHYPYSPYPQFWYSYTAPTVVTNHD